MRNSPSVKALQESRTVHKAPLHLVDESRTRFDNLLVILDEFDRLSEKYEDSPSFDGLYKMAEAILPISPHTAVGYCNNILEKYPFHNGANKIVEEFTHQKPPSM